MKVATTFHKKVPVPGVDYASQGFHLTIEAEPPPEVQQDRERLRSYVSRLFDECRARVEHELEQATGTRSEDPSANGNVRRHRGRPSSNGDNGSRSGNTASPKQINFIRSLANEANLGYGGLRDLAHDRFGKDVRRLSKREASQLIDELRA